MTLEQRARQAISLLDLTSLNDNDSDKDIERLCARAQTPFGNAAALCVWPRFLRVARRFLGGMAMPLAAVANFPDGSADIARAVSETRDIIALGGNEVDVVFPYRSWLDGDKEIGAALVRECKAVCGPRVKLKVILETGCLPKKEDIFEASLMAIRNGADFIKTSTGKTPISATPEAIHVMLSAIKKSVSEGARTCGLKISGGVRDAATAADYLDRVATEMGKAWITPASFRFGASSVLDSLIATAAGKALVEEKKNTKGENY